MKEDNDTDYKTIYENNAAVSQGANYDWMIFTNNTRTFSVDKTNTTRAARCQGISGVCSRKYLIKVLMTNTDASRYVAADDDKDITIEMFVGKIPT